MSYGLSFNVADRQKEKQVSRERDIERFADGSVSASELNARNGFFSVLDRSKVEVVARRIGVKIDRR